MDVGFEESAEMPLPYGHDPYYGAGTGREGSNARAARMLHL
jgi:hypothetical protein